jgi:flagellar hook assembly protein FlgD
MVTVTKNGYLPYVGSTWVNDGDAGVTPGAIRPLSIKVSPNPAAGSVRVTYAMPGAHPAAGGKASIEIYDARGRRVNSIPVTETTTSYNTVTWDGRSARGAMVPAGIYFLKISSGNDTISTKFVFLR